jgi:hypothetical protein
MKNLSQYFLIGVVLLGGCESDGDRYAGIEGTGERVTLASAYGTVSGFGSIYVNGVHFDTTEAEVEIAGEPADETDLAVGMVVEVSGEIKRGTKEGTAHMIRGHRVLSGVIESVELIGSGRKALNVLGQAVYVNEDATIIGTSFDELAPDLGIEVSGFVTDKGLITATYIARQDIDISVDAVEVEGYIDAVDSASGTFALKDLDVQINGAQFVGGTANDLAVGKRVRVVGTLAEDRKSLQAARIEFIARAIENGRAASVEGVVRNLVAGESFTLQGVQVGMRGARIENGILDDITTGAQVVAFGKLTAGVLQAERIRLKPLNTQRFRGEVTDIDAAAKTLVLLDITFQVTPFTQFRDESPAMERYFNFGSLRSGEELEIFAVDTGDQWQVTRITRRDHGMGPPNPLRGTVTGVSDDRTFYLNEIFVDAGGVAEHEWNAVRNRADDAFEADVEGTYSDEGHFVATHVHIRPHKPCDPHVIFECEDPKPPMPAPHSHRF